MNAMLKKFKGEEGFSNVQQKIDNWYSGNYRSANTQKELMDIILDWASTIEEADERKKRDKFLLMKCCREGKKSNIKLLFMGAYIIAISLILFIMKWLFR